MGTLLFITKYLEGDTDAIQKEALILVIPYVIVLIAVTIDLISGVMKAKAAGEARTSYGLRRTVSKLKDYYSLLLVSSLVDILLSIVEAYNLPFVTFAAALYLIVIEWLSIREKWDEKVRRRNDKDLKAILSVLENRGDLLKAFAEILNREIKPSSDPPNIGNNEGTINNGTIGRDNINVRSGD